MKARVTLRDIAAAAGVHYSTVSLALRNSPKVSASNLAKIHAAAKQLGYTVDPMLSALNAYRKSTCTPHYQATVAWVNNWPKRAALRGIATFNDYFLGADERARQLGYVVEEFWLAEPGMTPGRAMSILRARNVEAIILAPLPSIDAAVRLDLSKFYTVALGRSLGTAAVPVVASNQFRLMALFLQKLRELGYRHIGIYVPPDFHAKTDNNYLSAILLARHQRAGRFVFGDDTGNRADFIRWFRRERPEVVAYFDRRTQGWLEEIGLQCPRDVGLAHLSVKREEVWMSGIHENGVMIGSAAIDQLVGMIHRGDRGLPANPSCNLIESVWYPGSTLRQIRGG